MLIITIFIVIINIIMNLITIVIYNIRRYLLY